MSEILKILAAELEPDDVWLGETPDTELHVEKVTHSEPRPTIPWAQARTSSPVLMRPVIIEGRYHRKLPGGCVNTHGQWTLQPDQPLEVRRG